MPHIRTNHLSRARRITAFIVVAFSHGGSSPSHSPQEERRRAQNSRAGHRTNDAPRDDICRYSVTFFVLAVVPSPFLLSVQILLLYIFPV